MTPPTRPANWFIAFIILLALGGVLRLLDLTDPPLDFQPSRQLRNSLVARDIYYSMLPSATAEQKELASSFARSVGQYEPPVIESIVAVTFLVTGGENFIAARIWESLFWLAAGIALFDLMRRAVSPWAAVVAIAFYFVLPFSVQASRSFQPDPLMTAAFVAGIYFLYRWSEEQTWKWAILTGVFFGFATFVKIVIAFFVGAAAISLVLFTLKKDFWKSKQVWVMAAIMVVPAFLFYILLNQGRSTEYFFAWTVTLIKLITSADFYSKWLAFVGSIFGLTMIFLSLAGALIATPRLRWLLVSLWVGYVLYGLTLPFQMYTHSYYHIQLIPIIALGLASALNPLIESVAGQGQVGRVGVIALIVVVIGYQSWVARSVLIAEDFHHEPAFWKQVGDAIPANTDVIALTQDYGYRLMLFGWRKVSLWPLSTGLSEARGGNTDVAGNFADLTAGKEYFLVTAQGQFDKQPELKKILSQYPIAAQGEGYVLFDLRK
ncbi:MAG TPA: glycosyltransferase family 39 protein [Anaerolineales bacterium]|nr:glycosyltransferase family 39 protein [Anaerolineales bacterium]HMZ42819.1 glycosyltransferase family 39 protein [Anaerolineales bacterium]HNB87508.1 glycosyltransferase family 39 protein [Anaerolineales bacterium]HNE69526.1 glycosyltransferase family 39 protein [Anaerolineales bacterium]HNF34645.1 glycosyltransferase family 39 protein [Anaerolineales bacterium]